MQRGGFAFYADPMDAPPDDGTLFHRRFYLCLVDIICMLNSMEIWKSIILGCIQGVTEFLPVSSSGHLVLFKELLDAEQVPVLFDVLLHISTLIVVVVVFWNRIVRILSAIVHWVGHEVNDEDLYHLRLVLVIMLGTVFTAVLGFMLKDIELFRRTSTVSVLFIVTGGILISSKYAAVSSDQRPRVSHALWVGIAQGIGTLPGISRSGITITAALWGGMERDKAGELSFLISIPAILGALILERGDTAALAAQMSYATVAIGCVSAAVSGFISLKLLLWVIRSGRLYYFSIYLIPLGIISLIYV